jgi:hypothetical protein
MHRATRVAVPISDLRGNELVRPAEAGNDLTIDHADTLGEPGRSTMHVHPTGEDTPPDVAWDLRLAA